jgi:succinate dehydrogenase / fumarate reductase cytochrome b subunit
VSRLLSFLSSSIGRKVLMALTGLLLIGFLVAHLSANLLIFKSPEAFNAYSHSLISNPLIYAAELGLLVLFVAHLVAGIVVARRNRSARSVAYEDRRWAGSPSHKSWASTTMILSGIVVLAFVPLHILTFKFGTYYPSAEPGVRDLHRLVVEEFQKPAWVVWYVLAMIVIGFHLWHGFGSALETLGVHHRRPLRRFGQLLAVLIAGGFLLIPVILYLTGGAL